MTFTKQEQTRAIDQLKDMFEKYDTSTVFVVQKHVSRSGMQRKLGLFLLPKCSNGHPKGITFRDEQIRPHDITYRVARALNWSYDTKWLCVTVNGCGMNMHFCTVYNLSQVLFQDGFKLKHETI